MREIVRKVFGVVHLPILSNKTHFNLFQVDAIDENYLYKRSFLSYYRVSSPAILMSILGPIPTGIFIILVGIANYPHL